MNLRKQRADAKWNLLNDEQRELLEQWLFEERMSFDAALERAHQELGFEGSVSSIRRFYEHVAGERMFRNLVVSQEQIEQLGNAPVSTASMRAAGMKVVAHLFMSAVMQSPERVKEWSGMARLLLQSESNEIKYRLKQEENEIRREELAFAREKFHFDVMEKAQKALPELQALEEANLPRYEKNRRMNALRRSVFGPRIPEPLPESEEEEAEMARQKVIEDAERAKEHEWWMRTFGHLKGIKNEKLKMQNEAECSVSSSCAEAMEDVNVQFSAEGKDEEDASADCGVVLPDGQQAELGSHGMEIPNDQGQMTRENSMSNKKHLSPALVPTTASRGEGDDCATGGGERGEMDSAAGIDHGTNGTNRTNGTDGVEDGGENIERPTSNTEHRLKETGVMAACGVVERGVVYPYGQ